MDKVKPARLKALKPAKKEYFTLVGKPTTDREGIIRSLPGISDEQLNSKASQGWRVVAVSWSGRKRIAVMMERDRAPKKPAGNAKTPPPATFNGD